ncbi:MAG: hypothetical protein ABIG55_04880 [Candidatus Omnitrophota bacterium]|nr:hypothetical protein [Candidatus Omnitrophota bacterium]
MKKFISIFLMSCILFPQLAFAGAWTLPENNVRLEYLMKANWAKRDFTSNGDLRRKGGDARSWGWSMIPSVEYGVTDWFTIFGKLEYKEAKYKEYVRPIAWGDWAVKNHAVTNVDVGGKVRLLKDPVVLSAQVKGSVYTGYVEGDLTGKDEQPALSDRNDSIEIRGLVGKVFDTAIPFYLGAESGYRFNNRGVANDIPFFAEFGFWATDWLLLKTEVDGYWSHNQTGETDKDYAVWRIGPIFQLLDLYRSLTGEEITGGPASSVTQANKSLNLEIQYGNIFWGKDVSADQEVVMKISTQF